jgi:23S rRNA (guanosine2251-2'-O)-methyltransferase
LKQESGQRPKQIQKTQEPHESFIGGRNAVLAYLEGDKVRLNKVLIAQDLRPDARLERIKDLAKSQSIPVVFCERRKLDELSGQDLRHQGIGAFLSESDLLSYDDFLELFYEEKKKREASGITMDGYTIAILDGIEDPHNLGAIIRSAEASGIKAVFIPKHRSTSVTATVAKTSAGALAHIPVVRITNLNRLLEDLKEEGFWIAGLDVVGSQLYTKADLVRQLAVVIGSEGEGMSRLVKEHCDLLLKIPMLGKTESLNASVSAALLFYEIVRQNPA